MKTLEKRGSGRGLAIGIGLAGVLAVAPVGGCASSGDTPLVPRVVSSTQSVFVAPESWPFAAESVRVHPLTHVRAGENGGAPVIVMHIETSDAWGDPVKAMGQLEAVLTWPDGSAQDLHWSRDMTSPGTNSEFWERITRTYRVFLGQLPADVAGLLSRQDAGAPRATLRVVFRTHDAKGEVLVLRDEFVLGR